MQKRRNMCFKIVRNVDYHVNENVILQVLFGTWNKKWEHRHQKTCLKANTVKVVWCSGSYSLYCSQFNTKTTPLNTKKENRSCNIVLSLH